MAMDQESFEDGLLLGLNTALVILGRGQGVQGVRGQLASLQRKIDLRRNPGLQKMVAGDLYVAMPLAHPGDFGLPCGEVDQIRVAASMQKPAKPTPSRESGEGNAPAAPCEGD